ncbi:unnamed protein product, partial [Phaeothamnion confervicola]
MLSAGADGQLLLWDIAFLGGVLVGEAPVAVLSGYKGDAVADLSYSPARDAVTALVARRKPRTDFNAYTWELASRGVAAAARPRGGGGGGGAAAGGGGGAIPPVSKLRVAKGVAGSSLAAFEHAALPPGSFISVCRDHALRFLAPGGFGGGTAGDRNSGGGGPTTGSS